jgi:hypothetical protein
MYVLTAAVALSAALAAAGCPASGPLAGAAASHVLTAAAAADGRGLSVLPDTARGRTEAAPHRVRITKSYYASLCFYGYGQLGFGGKKFNPDYAEFARKLDAMVAGLGFRTPAVTGPFYQLTFQLPAYFDPKSPEEMEGLFAAVRRFIRSGSLDEFRKKWPAEARALEDWFPGGAKGYFQKTLGGREDVVDQALDTWAQYMKVLWPKYRPEYEAKLKGYPLAAYESECNKLGVFEAWQREFGVKYPYTDLVIVICPENPTMATSIGPDRVVFGAMHSLDDLRTSVVHEVGTRCLSLSLLFQDAATSKAMSADYEGMLKLVEMEVCFRTPRILPGVTKDSFVGGMRLEKLMAWRQRQELSGSLREAEAAGATGLLLQLYVRARRDGAL